MTIKDLKELLETEGILEQLSKFNDEARVEMEDGILYVQKVRKENEYPIDGPSIGDLDDAMS